MAVRSGRLVDGRPETGIVDAERLARLQGPAQQVIALAMALVSAVGNVLALVPRPGFDQQTLVGVGLGLAWQLVCTALQWVFCSRPWHPIYVLALVGSVVPSVLGYAPYTLPALAPVLTPLGALVFLAVTLAINDIYPERTLVRRPEVDHD